MKWTLISIRRGKIFDLGNQRPTERDPHAASASAGNEPAVNPPSVCGVRSTNRFHDKRLAEVSLGWTRQPVDLETGPKREIGASANRSLHISSNQKQGGDFG